MPTVNKTLVKNRLATVELALSKLEFDYDAAKYRQSPLVASCIKSAKEELELAFESLFGDRLRRAFELAGIAWLHTDFGRQLIDAEAIEHLLGESQYLELSEISLPWEEKAKQHIAFLEQEIKTLRLEISGNQGSKQ